MIVPPSEENDNTNYPISPGEFLQIMFGRVPSGFVEVCFLAPDALHLFPKTVVFWREMPLGNEPPNFSVIEQHNARGYGAYFGVTVRGRKYDPEQRTGKTGKPYTFYARGKAYDAQWLTALWIDVDEPGEAGYRRCIGSLPVQPSIVVSSGGGWHGYWLLTEPLQLDDYHRDVAKLTLKGMAIAAGSDPAVADLARIMRLPGTVNTKPGRDSRRCEVVDYLPTYYNFKEFEAAFAPLAAPKIQVTRPIAIAASAGLPTWCNAYLENGARAGERNKTAYAAARCMLDNGYSATDMERAITSRATADGLDTREIETLVQSAIKAPRGNPNVPTHIATRMSAADKRLSSNTNSD